MAMETANSVESIMAECEGKVRQGLGSKELGQEAREYWEKMYRKSISKKLEEGDRWNDDKEVVLGVAEKLGKVAAALTDGTEVQKWAAEAASDAVRKDPACPAGRGRGNRGGYCEPSA